MDRIAVIASINLRRDSICRKLLHIGGFAGTWRAQGRQQNRRQQAYRHHHQEFNQGEPRWRWPLAAVARSTQCMGRQLIRMGARFLRQVTTSDKTLYRRARNYPARNRDSLVV